jgi:DNA-binding NtrC family response regulator
LCPPIDPKCDARSSFRLNEDRCSRPPNERRAALAFIIDEEGSIRQFVSLILQGSGVDTIQFVDGASFREVPIVRPPELVFLNVNLEVQDAVASIEALSKSGFSGTVQLMSSRGSAVLDTVKQAGEQMKLRMLPVLCHPEHDVLLPGSFMPGPTTPAY